MEGETDRDRSNGCIIGQLREKGNKIMQWLIVWLSEHSIIPTIIITYMYMCMCPHATVHATCMHVACNMHTNNANINVQVCVG